MKERDKIPPQVPEALPQLDRAVMLLGAQAKGDQLKQKHQQELAQLLGRAPKSPEQAAVWKAALKALRKEEPELFAEQR